jgi:hypothetical protein
VTTPYAVTPEPRRTDPYLLTPIGRPARARYVLGPRLGPSYSELLAENERLREQCDNESELRIKAQDRLNKAMRVLASLGRLSPRMADLVEAARKDIFG